MGKYCGEVKNKVNLISYCNISKHSASHNYHIMTDKAIYFWMNIYAQYFLRMTLKKVQSYVSKQKKKIKMNL